MTSFKFLKDSNFKDHYLVSGSYKELLPLSKLRLEPRNSFDLIFLYCQFLLSRSSVTDNITEILVAKLEAHFPNLQGCLLFKTDWYKETKFIGLLKQDNRIFFIKIFNSFDEVFYQQNQFQFVQNHFSSYFGTIPEDHIFENMLICPFIKIIRPVSKKDKIEEHLFRMYDHFLEQFKINKTINEILPINLKLIFSDRKNLFSLINNWAQKTHCPLPLVPIHGDLTPWNIFIDEQDKITLTDYEAAGWHVLYYDYFHYILQPLGLKNKIQPLSEVLPKFDKPFYKECLVLYLVDQIYKHELQIKQHGFNDKFIKRLTDHKTQWLLEALNET